MIELYIENRKIDITDDLEINFNYETIDPDKLSAIKNSFSKTVNIPGTPNNNITFGHLFRYDKYIPISGPSNIENFYDPHKKVNWFINKNGSMINRGYCTLDNILVKSERNITYQLTLYGGIGEFFYSLSYNEDGSIKTLADMYWNWWPKIGLIGHGTQTTPTNENSKTLYKCSADIVASSYHNLNPLYTYEGTTEIEKDIVFVPCYTGLYEDFDSKHMLVSTFNQNYNSATPYMTNDTKLKLQKSFPDTFTDEDGTVYTTIGKNFSSSDAYKYGLVTFSRDLDPWEAGDLRINELPVAVRLSKLMNVISQPENNGGYDVIWDDDIKNSKHWLYSWVMLGKLKQDSDELNLLTISPNSNFDGQYTTINVDWQTGEGTSVMDAEPYYLSTNTTSVSKGNYNLNLNVNPNLTFKCNSFNYYASRYKDYISGSMHDNGSSFRYIWTTPVLVHKIYDGNTLIKTIADIFYFSTNPLTYDFGYNNNRAQLNTIKSVLNGQIQARMNGGIQIDQFNYHNCKIENPEVTGDGYINTVSFNCSNEKIVTNLNLNSDITDFKVEQIQGIMWTNLSNTTAITSGLYGTDNISFAIITEEQSSSPGGYRPSVEAPYGFITSQRYTIWHYNEFSLQASQNNSWSYFNLNEDKQNGLLSAKTSGFNIINLDKKTLFAQSQSPMKYLSGFCKLMNYRFICDETSKKIYIKTLKNYYLDRTINIDDRVDIGRDINIKNITTKYKTINVGLDTPETYPTYVFNKISKDKFNIKRYETGIEYNAGETNLLNDLTYKNLIDWQQSSVYYNLNPQFPSAYDVQSISWTLFNQDVANVDEIKKKEIFTVGTPSTSTSQLSTKDFLPKISIFNKENKSVDFESSLIFLNGFVKNYDYVDVPNNNKVEIQPDSINQSHFINSSGSVASSQYQDIYIYNVQPNTQYFVTASFSSGYSSYVVNYYNASGTRIGTEYSQANSSNYVDAQLTLPPNTATIRCNFRKSDTNAKMKVIAPNYVISPRVSFSNDMYEQYYLNQSRCYVYDFKYNDIFTSWGCYSNDQKGTASSWILPMFSRDLYNIYVPDIQSWNGTAYKFASWNLVNQDGLDNQYSLSNTDFIYNPNYNYNITVNSTSYTSNEYKIAEVPQDDEEYTERIYDKNWKDYLNDLYDRNTRDITAYVDLSGLGNANSIMRYIYAWKSHLWIITKLENFKIAETTHDKFTKVRLHKIKDINTWTN